MLHKGNISNIKVTQNDIVDVVIGGSPCQDLSVAGKRAGLKHEANGDEETTRSGLFMEQIRIMKEMRELDKSTGRTGVDVRCRWGVWENVPGALSSNQGEDFRIVLEEFCKVADPDASVPRPSKGKWSNSGFIMGDAFSVAWRIMDARYHGVPQRRRRITLVADFAGQSAPQILFDEEGMRWDFEASQEAWKRASGHVEHCSVGSSGGGLGVGTAGQVYLKFDPKTSMLWNNIRRLEMRLSDAATEEGRETECENIRHRLSGLYEELNEKVRLLIRKETVANDIDVFCLNPWDSQSIRQYDPDGIWPSLTANASGGQFRAGVIQTAEAFGETGVGYWQEGFQTLRAEGENRPSRPSNCVVQMFEPTSMKEENWKPKEIKNELRSQESKSSHCVVAAFMGGQGSKAGSIGYIEEQSPTLKSAPSGGNTVADVVYAIDVNVVDRQSNKNGSGYGENVSPTLKTQDRHAVVYDTRGNGDGTTRCTITGDHCNRVTDYTPIVMSETVGSLCARDSKGVGTQFVDENKVIVQPFDRQRIGQYGNGECGSTISCRGYKDAEDIVVEDKARKFSVRRLTPLECSRLQGLQDDWCVVPPQESVSDEELAFWKPFWDEWMQINWKKPKTENQITKWLMSEVSESAQYQMYGNGIAAPQWFWVCGRIIETYGEKKPTMASLFDGTGSFPWIWNSICGGEYTVWSSEVNPEAIRVSLYRIG